MSEVVDRSAPMAMAEAAECCGQLHFGNALEQCGTNFTDACENCPLIIAQERRERVLQAARAM